MVESKNKFITSAVIISIILIALGLYGFKKYYPHPCQTPITYSLGEIDPHFNISRDEVIKALKQTESIWETSIGKNLFSYSENGKLKISLVYDSRQESTIKLQQLGLNINEDKTTYDALKVQYNSLISSYNDQKSSLQSLIKNYDTAKAEYEKQATYWNQKGGAPIDEYNKLTNDKLNLEGLANQIRALQNSITNLVDNINATANVLNRIADSLNLNVSNYNDIGATQETEFQEGIYKKDLNGEEIIVYQFDSYNKLVRVLAHEFGHALGLEHTNDPNSIMYKINQGNNLILTPEDLSALKTMCHIK
jgi:predicted DNA-binding protein YlxM (UPF0122 family)